MNNHQSLAKPLQYELNRPRTRYTALVLELKLHWKRSNRIFCFILKKTVGATTIWYHLFPQVRTVRSQNPVLFKRACTSVRPPVLFKRTGFFYPSQPYCLPVISSSDLYSGTPLKLSLVISLGDSLFLYDLGRPKYNKNFKGCILICGIACHISSFIYFNVENMLPQSS